SSTGDRHSRFPLIKTASKGRLHWTLGVGLLGIAILLRVASGTFFFLWADAMALLPALAGAMFLLGGRRALQASWPAIAFLFFMIPLPYQVEVALGSPLQTLAARSSTFVLQALGQPVIREGNMIAINEVK